SLDPRQSIAAILEEPLRNTRRGTRAQRRSAALHHLELVSLPPEVADRRPRELSGGQRQRVAIARALILQPELVVLDEAVSALDATGQAHIPPLPARLQDDLGLTSLLTSHDLAVVRQVADTVSVLRRGRQVEDGPVDRVLERPHHEYTRALLAAIPGAGHPEAASDAAPAAPPPPPPHRAPPPPHPPPPGRSPPPPPTHPPPPPPAPPP